MSASQVVGAIVGVIVGVVTENPQLGFMAYAAVSGVGAYLSQPDQTGPRLEDLKTQMSTYGAPIPIEWGCNRHAGTIIWPQELVAVEHSQSESAKGGPEVVTFTYTLSFAVLVCEGPISGIRRIWANKKIVYDVSAGGDSTIADPVIGQLRFYLGTEDQVADPLIEAMDGSSPAYRGWAYIVFEDYDTTELNGRPPMIEVEVIQSGDSDFSPDLTLLDLVPAGTRGLTEYCSAFDSDRGNFWVHNGTKASISSSTGGEFDHSCINVYDVAARTRLAIISPGEDRDFGDLFYDPDRQEMYAGGEYTDSFGGTDTNAINIFRPDELYLSGAMLRSDTPYGVSWPPRPGIILGHGIVFIACTSSTHVGSGVVLWAPHLGPFQLKTDFPGEWTTQAISLANDHVVMIRGDSGSDSGIVIFFPDAAFFYTFLPQTSFGNAMPVHISEDRERERIMVCSDTSLFAIDIESEVVSTLFDTGSTDTTVCSIHDNRSDRVYIISTGSGIHTFSVLDPDTLAVINTFDLAGMDDVPTEVFLSPVAGEIVIVGRYSVWLLSGLYATLEPGQVPLSTIVSDICLRTELTAGDIDVTELTDGVDGYIVPRQMTARSAISPLQQAFSFDVVESDDKIKFVKRDSLTVTTIAEDDRAAHEFGSQPPDALSITRPFELEVPFQCEVEYPDLEADHLIGTQYDRRLTKASREILTVQIPVVMTKESAKRLARVLLYEAWQLGAFRWTTTRKFAKLEPSDKVLLPTQSVNYTARITQKREQPNGVIEWEGNIVDLSIYDMTGDGAAPTNYAPQSIYNPGDTILRLIDTAMLRDDDDNAGFYVAMAGSEEGWKGAQLFRSSDGGANYVNLFGAPNEAAIGLTMDALADFTAGNIFDEGNTVDVFMSSGQPLVSVTQDQVLNGSNKAVIGAHGRWEVVHFKNAELIAADTYRLSGFLRGCRGTEWATGTHVAGDSFVLASTTTWNRLNAGDTGLLRTYKAPPVRVRLDAVDSQDFTNSSVALKPFSPVDAAGARNGSDDLDITWARRTRLAAGTLYLPVLLGEASEAYEIDVMDGDDVLRTITSATQSATYLASEQTADGITPGDPVTVRIYQMSAAVGRGYPLEVTL